MRVLCIILKLASVNITIFTGRGKMRLWSHLLKNALWKTSFFVQFLVSKLISLIFVFDQRSADTRSWVHQTCNESGLKIKRTGKGRNVGDAGLL